MDKEQQKPVMRRKSEMSMTSRPQIILSPKVPPECGLMNMRHGAARFKFMQLYRYQETIYMCLGI